MIAGRKWGRACYQFGGNTPDVAALVGPVDGGHLRLLAPFGMAAGRLRTLLAKYPRMDVCDASLFMLSEMRPAAKVVTLGYEISETTAASATRRFR